MVTISPVPARDYILVSRTDGNVNQADISLYSFNGTLMISEVFMSGEKIKRIDVSSLPNGIYYVKYAEETRLIVVSR